MLTREEVERRLRDHDQRCQKFTTPDTHAIKQALQTAQALYAERDELRETVTRLNRRCTKAEAFADKSIEQLCDAGQRTFGRMLANYAAESALRKVEELEAERDQLAAEGRLLHKWLLDPPRNTSEVANFNYPLIAAEAERVQRLEAVAEAGAAYRHLIRCDPEPERYIEVETLGVAFDAALAAWREGRPGGVV